MFFVVVPGRACLVCPGVGDCVSLACPCPYHSPAWHPVRLCRRQASESDMSRVPVIVLSSSHPSHHLVLRWRFRSHRPRAPPRPSRRSLFSSDAAIVRRTAGVSHPSFGSFSYELGKTARNVISCSIALGCPQASRFSSRLAVSWSVSCRIIVVVFARGGCRVLRFCSLASRRGGGVIRFSCGVAVCLSSSFACRLVRFSSLRLVWRLVCLFYHALRVRAAWRACSSHRVCSSRGGGRCRSWCRGVLPCLPVSSDLLFSCRRSWRLVSRLGEHLVGVSSSMMYPLRRRGVLAAPRGFVSSHRLVERGGFGFSSHLGGERMGGGSRHAVSEPVLACLDAVGDGGNAVLIIGVPACSLSSYGCGAWGRAAPPPHLAHRRLFLVPGAVALASCRLSDSRRTGRKAGRRARLLGYCGVAHRVSSMDVYNEYDVCDVYKRYKDIRIRKYDGYMG